MGTDAVIRQIIQNRSKGKRHNLVVVAEGVGKSAALAKKIQEVVGIESRATILGHLQRGGMPSALDRFHGSRMGFLAVEAIKEGKTNMASVYSGGHHVLMDLEEALTCKKEISMNMYEMIKILAI
jgi:6-phosphofructokinase 1